MFVCKEKNFLFIHIPKTAGTSMRKRLKAVCADHAPEPSTPSQNANRADGISKVQQAISASASFLNARQRNSLVKLVQLTPLRYYLVTAGHPSAALISMMLPDFENFFKFAFVRNPFDRLVSAYENLTEFQGLQVDFGKFVNLAPLYVQPQVNFVFFYSKCLVDFIGKYETLQEDFRKICVQLDLPTDDLALDNSSKRKDYRNYFTPNCRKKAEAMYEKDLRAFDYQY